MTRWPRKTRIAWVMSSPRVKVFERAIACTDCSAWGCGSTPSVPGRGRLELQRPGFDAYRVRGGPPRGNHTREPPKYKVNFISEWRDTRQRADLEHPPSPRLRCAH